MATTYNTAFGSLPGYNEMLGTTNTTGGGQQQVYGQRAQQQRTTPTTGPFQTFAQMQKSGLARPAAPTAPTAEPFAQYGGSTEAQQMRQRLKSQLETFGKTPSRFDTQAFQQIRGAQAANLQQEYRGQLQALNEELARRGLSASSVGGGRMGDLAGQQARALASLDAELLQRAAETQAQDRAQLLQAGQGFAELAGAQDLAQFEASRAAQAATFENQLREAQFRQQQFEQYGQEAFQSAQAEEAAQQAARAFDLQATGQVANLSLELQRLLGQQELERAQLTGRIGTGATAQDTLAARQLGLQEAGITGMFGGQLTQEALQNAYQRAAQLSQVTGQQYTVDPKTGAITASGDTLQAQLQRAGITGTLGGALTQEALQNAYARAAQLTQATGLQHTVDPKTGAITAGAATEQSVLQRAELTGTLGGTQTLAALQQALQNAQFLTAQTGNLYEVNTLTGKLEAKGSTTIAGQMASFEQAQQLAQQRMAATGRQFAVTRDDKTGMYSVAEKPGAVTAPEAQQAFNRALLRAQQLEQTTGFQYEPKFNEATQQWETAAVLDERGLQRTSESGRRFDLEQNLRAYLGLTEASGFVYNPLTGQLQRTATGAPQETVQGQIARSQTLLSLAQALGNLTPEQIAQLLGKASPIPTGGGGGGTTTTPPTNPKDGDRKTEGGKTFVYRGTWPTGQWVEITSTTTTTGDTKPTQPTTTTTKPPEGPTTSTTKAPLGDPADARASAILSSVYPWAFNGAMVDLVSDGQTQWYVFSNNQWYKSNPPTMTTAKDPTGTFDMQVYPGATTTGPNNMRYYWNGSRWLS